MGITAQTPKLAIVKNMRSLVYYIIFCFFSISANAQEVKNIWAYGGYGSETAVQNCVDNMGNRYTAIEFRDHNFLIDSAGTPIIIAKNPNNAQGNYTIAIIKFNSNGQYLHHIRLNTTSIGGANAAVNLLLRISSINELIIHYRFRANDSANLIDSRGILFKKVLADVPKNSPHASKYFAYFTCKVNSNGQFIWVNTIANEGVWKNLPPKLSSFMPLNVINNLTILANDDIFLAIDNDRIPLDNSNDTLTITNTWGVKSNVIINTKCVLLKFNTHGELLLKKEILKNRVDNNKSDTMIRFDYFVQTDGANTYNLFQIYIDALDTFKSLIPIPLKIGYNFILVKLDSSLNIIWSKPVGYSQKISTITSLRPRLTFDKIQQELILGLNILPQEFSLHDTSVKLVDNIWQVYYCRIKANGDLKYSNLMLGSNWGDFLNKFIHNPITNQLYAIVQTSNENHKIGDFNLKSTFFGDVLLTFDSSNNLIGLKRLTRNFERIFSFSSDHVIDHLGSLYLPGRFQDTSIQIDCKKAFSSEFNGTNAEAMVIKLGPLKPIYLQ
ncbi:MAG: hypothetical protein Q8R57_00450, partial [Bacteroidota bacterium]|nr:hypothetical protein [Bacteroidota bacterium]